MPASRPLVRFALAAGVVALVGAAYGVGYRAGRAAAPAPAPAAPPPTGAPGPGMLPATTGMTVRDGGSYFYSRASTTNGEPTAIDGELLTDRPDECTDGCPIGMRVVVGTSATARAGTALASMAPELDALEAAAVVAAPAFAATLRRVRAQQTPWAAVPTPPDRARRVLALGMPRPDFGERAAMIVFAAYDHCDPIFDANRPAPCAVAGAHLLVARIDRHATDRPQFDVVTGLVEVETREATGGAVVDAPPAATPVMNVVHPVYMHFGGARGEVHGLFLAPDGTLHRFGADRVPVPVTDGGALRDAVIALLRRA